MAATWKVETAQYSGTAFHIGDGRFLTAHHVIDGQPPFVALLHGDRVLPAMVLGSDPDVDVALLETARPGAASDIPAVIMRDPVAADAGSPVQLVGYPSGGPLTVSYGGAVSRVWEDEIQTTASSAGGNSGGPMFDNCGEVLGVLWAGSSDANFSHSSTAVRAALARMTLVRPSLPEQVPEFLQGEGRLVWHYGAEPPPMIDCSGHDGEWWAGVIEERAGDLQYALDRAAESVSPCSWQHVAAVGWTGDLSSDPDSGEEGCTPRSSMNMNNPGEAILAELGAWDRSVGHFRFRIVEHQFYCPGRANYSLLFEPAEIDLNMKTVLVAADGRSIPGGSEGWGVVTSSGWSASTRIVQDWDAPTDFTPAAVRVTVTRLGASAPLLSETLPLNDAARIAAGPALSLSLKIAARVDPESGAVQVCIKRPGEALGCPERGLPAAEPGDRSWLRTSPLS